MRLRRRARFTMLASLLSPDDRSTAWSSAASLIVHLCLAFAIAVPPLRLLPPEPPKPLPATTAEVEISQDELRDESGFGTNRSTPTEVAARSHAVRGGPERAPRLQTQRNARGATTGRPAATPSHEEPVAAAMAPVESSGVQFDAPLRNTGFPTGIEDPLDRVLGMRAERDQVVDASAIFAQTRSVRTGSETTVMVSAPALADGAGLTEGFGVGTGGRRRWPGPDQSSPARLGGPVWWWYCPWPAEADALPIRHATAKLVVAVTSDGHATSARLIEDALGFGAAARRCAMEHVYISARDRDGRPVPGPTLPFVVRFDR